MTDGYLSKDRDRLNRMQGERANLASVNKRQIETARASTRPQPLPSEVSQRIARAGEGTKSESGISEVFAATRASKSGPKLRKWQRLPCGAKRRRDGKPCQALSVPGKQRCKWHGGCSTGPTTPEGKARALANLKQHAGKG